MPTDTRIIIFVLCGHSSTVYSFGIAFVSVREVRMQIKYKSGHRALHLILFRLYTQYVVMHS